MTTTPASDPKPSVDRIDELARRILSGDILLPKFQREFVWKKPRILALLDSIAKNYPIGSILLWRTRQELKSERRIADLDVAQQQQEYPFNYLLDGQQRLSTICGALFWNGADPKSQWNIAYDLREQKFIHPLTVGDLPVFQIRVNRLSNPSQYFQRSSGAGGLPGWRFETWQVPRGFGRLYRDEAKRQLADLARGRPGSVISVVADLLRLIGYEASRATIADWPLRKRVEAVVYAATVHARAGDNPVQRHPELEWLPESWNGPPAGVGLFGGPSPTEIK